MGTVDLPKSPYSFSPPAVATVDFRDLPTLEDLQQTAAVILAEEAANVTHYFKGRLPPEILQRLDITGYFNRHYDDMFNRYLASDEKEEPGPVTRRTAVEIAELLQSLGGAGKFNTGEIEKSAAHKGNIKSLEVYANNILRRRTETGTFLHADAAGSIVKCVFRDNALKPGTVTDVKLAINIPDTDLISHIFHRYAAAQYLIKDLISKHITESIEREIAACEDQKLEEGIAKLFAENTPVGFNLSNIRGSLRKNADIETIRDCGFTIAAHTLVKLLERAPMEYQFFEFMPNGRELVIREYENADVADLPDERYQIRLRYFDQDQLVEDCKLYDEQMKDFEHKARHLWNLIEVNYQDSKNVFKVNDFEDLAKKNKSRIRDLIKKKNGESVYEITGEPVFEKGKIRAQLARMRERIKNMYEFLYPIERRIMEDHLDWLETECSRLDFIINPRHLQPGLLIDVDITSIKRKRTTLESMANVLTELLNCVFRGFQDAAFAAFRLPFTEDIVSKTIHRGTKARRSRS